MDIYEFIRTQNVNVLLEIGCHFGEDTKRFRDMLPTTCRIFAFEADPRNVKIIRESKVDSLALALSRTDRRHIKCEKIT